MSIHKPVLLKEIIEGLNLQEGSVVVDATLGGGGHSRAIMEKIGKKGKLIAIDWDAKAIENFKQSLLVGQSKVVSLVQDNFAGLKKILGGLQIEKATAILADLGFSSDQLEDSQSGLSFQKDGPLDMRLDPGSEVSAGEIINHYPLEKLTEIIRELGEERWAFRIAKRIVDQRKKKKILTTGELRVLIESAVPQKHFTRIHPATKTFQALRISVNRELENLKSFIPQAIDSLAPGGRLAIISFHSLEDRIVKNIFRENARGCICPKSFPRCVCHQEAKIKIITKKPIVPTDEEISHNPRSRSAKLRLSEKM